MPTYTGTDAGEVLTGSGAADLIDGLGGADTITGGGGGDTLRAGDGDDLILGPGGAFGGPGGLIDGGAGVDTLDVSGYQIPAGMTQSHTVTTGTGVVTLSFFSRFTPPPSTGPITTTALGTVTGVEVFNFGAGSDSLNFSFLGAVTVAGGAGNDTILGGTQGGTLYGDAGDDSLRGGGAADRLEGGAGNDTVTGGGGADTLLGGDGDDRLVYSTTAVVTDGGAGIDTLDLSGYNASAFFFTQPLTIRPGQTAGSLEIDTFYYERGGGGQTVTATGYQGIEKLILGIGTSVNFSTSANALTVETRSAGESITTGSSADTIILNPVNNSVAVGHTVNGNGGTDTLILGRPATGYLFQQTADGWKIYEGSRSVHTVTNIEQVQFNGGGPSMSIQAAAASDFDALAYLARYADVRAFAGTDLVKAFQHYQDTGADQGRIIKPFDALTYIASSPDLIRAFGTNTAAGTAHFEQYYALYPRSIDSFSGATYIASNPDLIVRFGADSAAATRHYIETGFAEGRPTATFDPLIYAASSPDLARAFGLDADAAARHYITYSPQNTHPVSGFEPLVYLASNLQLAVRFGTNAEAALNHYLTNGARAGLLTNTFDPLNYAASSVDLALAFGTNREAATLHYLTYWPQATHPVGGFDAVAYQLTYGEQVGKTPTEATVHWLQTGAKAGLAGDAVFGRDQTNHSFNFTATSVSDKFHAAGDRDWFTIYSATPQTWAFDGSAGVATLSLHDAKGNLIASDADGRNFQVTVTATTFYYLVATANGVADYTISRAAVSSADQPIALPSTPHDSDYLF